jgi:hypothetical protein
METAISQRGVGTGLGLRRFLPLGVEKTPAVAPIICFIDENYIDASALYYTEIEEFFEAEIHMENTMNFAPRGHSGSL